MITTITPPDGDDDRYQLGEEKNDGAELTAPSTEGYPVDKNEPTSGTESSRTTEEVTSAKSDIFDDLIALGRPLDEVVPSEKVLTSLEVRKPKRDEWVRLHSEIHARVHAYDPKDNRSWFVVLPEVVEPLLDVLRYVQMSLAVNYAGTLFIWPVPIPTERHPHQAHISALAAAEQAMQEWIRISWGGSDYDVYRRSSAKVDPVWPAEIKTASEMLRFASKAGSFEVIGSMDHPVIRRHLGLD